MSRSNRRGAAGRFSCDLPLLQQRRPVQDWPIPDRTAWEVAVAPAGPFAKPGPAAHLAATTRRARTGGYGQFLSYLDETGQLLEDEGPEQRITVARLGGYIASLWARVTARTVQQQIRELRYAIQAMVPERDWGWIVEHPALPSATEVRAEMKPKPKLDIGALMSAATAQLDRLRDTPLTVTTATAFRNHLLVALTAYRPLRRRNLAATKLKRNLIDIDGRYILSFSASETKTGAVIEQSVPADLAPYLEHYLSVVRPFLMDGEDHDYLWVGRSGKPLGYGAFRGCFEQIGKQLLGRAVSVHEFRHGVSTLTIENDPRDLDLAAAMLGHVSNRSVNEYYDRSAQNTGAQVWQQLHRKFRGGSAAGMDDD